jgi:ssRNA-specific RNase YbeY (16S rRNA maturation enzyme)
MHLLGYDHEDSDNQQQMRREEEAVLGRLNLTR